MSGDCDDENSVDILIKIANKYGLTIELHEIDNKIYYRIRKTILPGIPIPTGEEFNEFSDKKRNEWVKMILSGSYVYSDHFHREQKNIISFYNDIDEAKLKSNLIESKVT